MHTDNGNVNSIERNRFQYLQFGIPRLQAEVIDFGRVHGQQQRIQRETFDASVEPLFVVYQRVRVYAVYPDVVEFVLVEAHLFGVRVGAQEGVDRFRAHTIVFDQVEVVPRIRLYQ